VPFEQAYVPPLALRNRARRAREWRLDALPAFCVRLRLDE